MERGMHDTGAVKGVLGNGTELIKVGLSEEVTLELMRISQSCQMPGFFFYLLSHQGIQRLII